MLDTVKFELVSPQRLLKSVPVEMVVVPGAEGDFGVLAGHSLLIATVRPGVVNIYWDGEITESIFVAGGFAEVSPERCTVLAEEAVPVTDIDRGETERRLEAAEAALAKAQETPESDTTALERDIKTAEAMLVAISQN